MLINKPKKRSRARILMGKAVFRLLRYYQWYLGGKKYAEEVGKELLQYRVFSHRTPLIRKLKDLDMYLQYNKIDNLRIAARKLNGIILKPGETLSYWKLIGKPTRRKGYKEGLVLFCGKLIHGIGGGLCQMSNLIYWMTLHTPLSVTERYRHSYDVFPDADRTQPFGSGATCVYNYRDLQIYNGTDATYQLAVYVTDQHLVGEWRSDEEPDGTFEVYEKSHSIEHAFWGEYIRKNELYRRVIDKYGIIKRDEFITGNEAVMMYQPYIEDKSRC